MVVNTRIYWNTTSDKAKVDDGEGRDGLDDGAIIYCGSCDIKVPERNFD